MTAPTVAPAHECAARGCGRRVPANRLMCGPHWRKVPRQLRLRVWGTYRPGQELDHDLSPDYVHAVRLAVVAVARKESHVD